MIVATAQRDKVEKKKADLRFLVNAKKEAISNFEPYTQVFSNKHGFIENLSILDLLFMEGPNTISFLEKVAVTLE